MVVNSKFLHRCIDTQMFFFHGFYNHSLEFRRISFVWYSFWHSKTPHFLDSISYCLTNGVQFSRPDFFISIHGIGVELEEKLDAGFEQRMIFERGVGGEELLGGGLRLVQER